jgi:purine-nucleoside phosphorylase
MSIACAAVAEREWELSAAVEVVRRSTSLKPAVGIILGTGLGGVAEELSAPISIDYQELPGFVPPTATGHRGRLTLGHAAGVPVAALEGRLHRYEGHSSEVIGFPMRLLHRLGIGTLIVTNASGGLNPLYEMGDLLVIADHINLMWRGLGLPRDLMASGDRRPFASQLYDPDLIARMREVARRENASAHCGVYLGVTGPNYETRAEYRCFRRLGADAVGMSTVPEVVTAAGLGLRVLGLSTITNVCRPDALGTTGGDEVVAAAAEAEPRLRRVILELLRTMAGDGLLS